MKSISDEFKVGCLVITTGVIIFTVLVVFSSSMEARAYNRLTEGRPDATWWDALFVELRVDCN